MPHSPFHMHDGADAARSGMPTGQRPEPSGWDIEPEPGIRGKITRFGQTLGRKIEDHIVPLAQKTREGLAKKPKPEIDDSGWR